MMQPSMIATNIRYLRQKIKRQPTDLDKPDNNDDTDHDSLERSLILLASGDDFWIF